MTFSCKITAIFHTVKNHRDCSQLTLLQLVICSRWRGVTSHGGWRRTPPLRAALWPSPLVLSAGVRQQKAGGNGASGRVRRREGRGKHRLWSGRLLHASPDPPQTAVVGKPPLQCVGLLSSMDGPTCTPSPLLSLSLSHSRSLCVSASLPADASFIQSG